MKATTRSSEFVRWQHFFELEYNTPDRGDHYLMQIAAQIERFMQAFTKNPRMIALADFIIKFTQKQEEIEAGNRTHTTTISSDTVIVIADGRPGELTPSYTDPSELDPERIKLATERSNMSWGLWAGAILENRRRRQERQGPREPKG